MEGWISLHRILLKKPIWLQSTPEQKSILITILMMVNHDESDWEWKGEKYVCQPGQMVTSLDKIAQNSGKGISIQNVRTAIARFEKFEFLTNESTNSNRLITICNWNEYQTPEIEQKNDNPSFVSPLLVDCYPQVDSENLTKHLTNTKTDINSSNSAVYPDNETEPNNATNKQLTSDQQATNKQLTTNNNDNNDNNKNIVLQSSDCANSENEVIKEKPKRKRTAKPKKTEEEIEKETDLNKKSREAFEARFFRLFKEKYQWQGKDAGNMTRVLNALKDQRKHKGLSNENNVEVVAALSSFLNEAVKDEWIVKNFSISVLYSKFNEIVARAKAKEQERKNERKYGVK